MSLSRTSASLALISLALVGLGLSGCSAAGGGTSAASSASAGPQRPADLTGEWKQTNSRSNDSYQEATITADAITVDWVTDNGLTTSLYWAGSFSAPTKTGTYAWTSTNDTAKTKKAQLASTDDTKKFTFDGTTISFEATELGSSTTIELAKK